MKQDEILYPPTSILDEFLKHHGLGTKLSQNFKVKDGEVVFINLHKQKKQSKINYLKKLRGEAVPDNDDDSYILHQQSNFYRLRNQAEIKKAEHKKQKLIKE